MARTQTSKTRALPGNGGGSTGRARRVSILVLLYVTIVLAHILAFRNAYQFPYMVTDAVQYVTTAQNIASGHGYTIRGKFNSTNPPLYPAFLALTISQGDDPMWPAFVWQTILFGLIVFPAYSLAREAGLEFAVSVVLAGAAGMLPQSFFCAFYMQEVLQYPLWMWFCALVYWWLHTPSQKGGVWLGIALSLLILNKVNSVVLVFPMLVACGAKMMDEVRCRGMGVGTAVKLVLVPVAIPALTLGAWLAFKYAHGVGAMGFYGVAAVDALRLGFSLPLFLAYISDFFLASGLLCVVPVCYFLIGRWNSDRPAVLFFAILFGIQIVWIGIFEGGLSGTLRERLMSFSFPVVAILAVRGFVDLREHEPRGWKYWFVAVPLVMLLAVRLGDPGKIMSFERPWSFAFGAGFVESLSGHVKDIYAFAAASVAVVSAAALLAANRRRAALLLAVFILVCNTFTFAGTASFLSAHSQAAMLRRSGLVGWLRIYGAGYGARVLVVSHPAMWELRPFADPSQGLLLGCTTGSLPDLVELGHVETILRWDVRTVCTAKEIADSGRRGDLILAEEDLGALPNVRPVATMSGTRWRLFRLI